MMNILGYRLEGGGACPEQYDVYFNDVEVGYLRLRHGSFTAECGPFNGFKNKIVYRANPKGDGIFEDEEREFYLTEAIKAIHLEREIMYGHF